MSSTTVKRIKRIAAFLTGAVVLLCVWTIVRRNAPPLRLSQVGAEVNVDVSTLGEYSTTVNRIRVSDEHGSTVWELAAAGNVAQIHGFVLNAGDNPVNIDTDFGRYVVEFPRGPVFTLRKGTRYTVEVWGRHGLLAKTSAQFQVN